MLDVSPTASNGANRVPNLKIATFNINGIRSRLPTLLTWLQEASPDIVCLQELKAIDSAFPVAAVNAAGYGTIWQGQRVLSQ